MNRHVTSSLKTLNAPWPTWRQPPSKHPSWASQSWQRRDTSPYHQRRKDYQVLQEKFGAMRHGGKRKTPISDFTRINTVLKKSQEKMFQVSSLGLKSGHFYTVCKSHHCVFQFLASFAFMNWMITTNQSELLHISMAILIQTVRHQYANGSFCKTWTNEPKRKTLAMFNLNPSNLSAFIFQPKFWESPVQHLCAKAPLHPRTYRDRPQPHWLCLPDLGPRPGGMTLLRNQPVSLVDGPVEMLYQILHLI